MGLFERTIDSLERYYEGLLENSRPVNQDEKSAEFFRDLLKDNGIEMFARFLSNPDAEIEDEASLIGFLKRLQDFERTELNTKEGEFTFPVEIDAFRKVAKQFQCDMLTLAESQERATSIKRKILKGIKGAMLVAYINDIGVPLSNMVSFHERHKKDMLSLSEGVSVPLVITPEDLYDALKKHSRQDYVIEQLSKLQCQAGILPQLLASYSSSDRQSFSDIIFNEKVDISSFIGYVLLSEVDTAEPTVSNGGIPGFLKGLRRIVHKILDSSEPSIAKESDIQKGIKTLEIAEELMVLVEPISQKEKLPIEVIEQKLGKSVPILERLMYFLFKRSYSEYLSITDTEEKRMFDEVLSRPTGRHFLSKFLTRFNKENTKVQRKIIFEKQLTLGQNADGITLSLETSSLFTLEYDSSFITEEEFVSMPVMTDDKGMYYEGSKTLTLDDNEAHNSYVNTTLLYEYLAKKAIEHCPQNYYAFLYRMTARRRPEDAPESFRQIPFLLKDKDGKPNKKVLAYYIGRVVHKVKDYKKDTSVPTESGIKKAKYENNIWNKSFKVFFDAGEYSNEVDMKRMSEEAAFKPKPRDSHKASINRIAVAIFGEIE